MTMRCPACGEKAKTTDSRAYADAVVRRHRCECGNAFVTEERVVGAVRPNGRPPKVARFENGRVVGYA